jgi:hypothetical protein
LRDGSAKLRILVPTLKGPLGFGEVTEAVVDKTACNTELLNPALCVTPTPDKLTFWGLSGLLSAIERTAVRVPLTLGLKVTVIWQEPAAATLLPHVFVCANSRGSVPPIVIPEMFKVEFPVLVRFINCGELVEFTRTLPKSTLSGTSSTVPDVTVMLTA